MGLPSLLHLDLASCTQLGLLPEHGLTSLANLTALDLFGYVYLRSACALLTAPELMCCVGSSGIQSLSEDMGMPHLRKLDLQHCLDLIRLPEHGLTSLTSLTLLQLNR